jgi:hypothetical protein
MPVRRFCGGVTEVPQPWMRDRRAKSQQPVNTTYLRFVFVQSYRFRTPDRVADATSNNNRMREALDQEPNCCVVQPPAYPASIGGYWGTS